MTTIDEKTLRLFLKRILEGSDLGTEPEGPVEVNAVVDPSAAETDPINPAFSPQNKAEFDVASRNLVRNLPDDQMPGIYDKLKDVVSDQLAAAADDEQRRRAEKSGTPMQSKSGINVEEVIRQAIKNLLAEAPATAKKLDEPVSTDDDEMQFKDMARELGHGDKVHNARQEYNRALTKLKFLASMDPKEREHLIKTAFDDFIADLDEDKEQLTPSDFRWLVEEHSDLIDEYVAMLRSAGDLTAGDIMLLRDHPMIVAEQPGFRAFLLDYHTDVVRTLPSFREYLHDYVRSAHRGHGTVEIPDAEEERPIKKDKLKTSYKVWKGRGPARRHVRIAGKVFVPSSSQTGFNVDDQVSVTPKGSGMTLKAATGDHTQDWVPEGSQKPGTVVKEVL